MDTKLSIITATFNAIKAGRGEMLRRCVASVAKLRVPHEHLIYDGASTDGSAELLRELERGYPDVRVVSEPDTGIYDAFNKGWRNANGEWIYYLGDDDYLISPETLDEVIAEIADASEDMVLSPVERPGIPQLFTSWGAMRSVLTVTPYCHQGVLMRRSLVEKLGGFDERFRISADYDLFLKAHFSNEPCRCILKVYAFFNNVGVSAANDAAHWDMVNVSAKHLGLNEKQRHVLFERRLLPVLKLIPMLFHRSEVIRMGARHAIKRNVAWLLGMLDESGGPKRR